MPQIGNLLSAVIDTDGELGLTGWWTRSILRLSQWSQPGRPQDLYRTRSRRPLPGEDELACGFGVLGDGAGALFNREHFAMWRRSPRDGGPA
jgi:hypothetical protein